MVLDTFIVDLINQSNQTFNFYRQYSNCYKCPLILTSIIKSNENKTIELRSYFKQLYALNDYLYNNTFWTPVTYDCNNNNDTDCNIQCEKIYEINANDKSHYQIIIDNDRNCHLKELESGENQLISSLIIIVLFITNILLIIFLKKLWNNYRCRNRNDNSLSPSSTLNRHFDTNINNNNNNNVIDSSIISSTMIDSSTILQSSPSSRKSNRLHSIDAFRGMAITLMIFVNYGAGQYKQLQHVPWDGFQLADLVFPFFIFAMGMSIAVSFKNVQRINENRTKTIEHIVKRSIKLFLLGIVVNSIGSADIKTIRIPGVLQRFAVSYGIVAIVQLLTINIITNSIMPRCLNCIKLWPQYALASIMIILYSYLSFGWQYDQNCPKGYLGPGGLYNNVSHPFCIGGAAHRLDELIFTRKHCYRGNFAAILYDQGFFQQKLWHDPEGLLGTTNSIVLTIIGLQIGHIVLYNVQPWARFRRFIQWIILLGTTTLITIYGFKIPINKNLWSISFVTFMGCLATMIYALFHYLIDLRQLWPNGQPFHFAGQNSLLLYFGHEIAENIVPFKLSKSYQSHYGYLSENLFAVIIWLLISYWLSINQIFITV